MRDWLSYRARIDPGREALVDAATGDSYTFGTLDRLVEDLAGRLVATGVEPGDHLGAVLPPRVEYVCLVHAAMRLGATLVPMGATLTGRELAAQVAAADVSTVVCGSTTEDAVTDAVARCRDHSDTTSFNWDPAATADGDDPENTAVAVDREITVVTVDDPEADGVGSLSTASAAPIPSAPWSLDDTQLVLFTSGTTGDPKPVRLTTGNLFTSAAASVFRLGFDPGDRWLVTLPLHHAGGLSPLLRMPVYGMTVVLREGFDAGGAADDLDRYDATAVSLVPTMLRRMLDRRGTLTDSLRIVLLGGAPAPTDLIERCRNYSVPVHPTYGMTEAASQIATARPDAAFASPEAVGPPLFLTDVTVVDDDGDPVPSGETGELVVDGPTITPGYYGDSEATDAAFGEFGFHTGDAGFVDESGAVTVLNRLDDRIVTGGETVDPGEVADVLATHPAVRAATVVGVPDSEWGQRVAAAVVAGPAGSAPDAEHAPKVDRETLLEFARERLAGHKLPKTIASVESLPRTPSGTVDRDAVREQLLDTAIEDAASADVESADAASADAAAEDPDATDTVDEA
jgi:O-succinylbenzoic acid--CoA ligase